MATHVSSLYLIFVFTIIPLPLEHWDEVGVEQHPVGNAHPEADHHGQAEPGAFRPTQSHSGR